LPKQIELTKHICCWQFKFNKITENEPELFSLQLSKLSSRYCTTYLVATNMLHYFIFVARQKFRRRGSYSLNIHLHRVQRDVKRSKVKQCEYCWLRHPREAILNSSISRYLYTFSKN